MVKKKATPTTTPTVEATLGISAAQTMSPPSSSTHFPLTLTLPLDPRVATLEARLDKLDTRISGVNSFSSTVPALQSKVDKLSNTIDTVIDNNRSVPRSDFDKLVSRIEKLESTTSSLSTTYVTQSSYEKLLHQIRAIESARAKNSIKLTGMDARVSLIEMNYAFPDPTSARASSESATQKRTMEGEPHANGRDDSHKLLEKVNSDMGSLILARDEAQETAAAAKESMEVMKLQLEALVSQFTALRNMVEKREKETKERESATELPAQATVSSGVQPVNDPSLPSTELSPADAPRSSSIQPESKVPPSPTRPMLFKSSWLSDPLDRPSPPTSISSLFSSDKESDDARPAAAPKTTVTPITEATAASAPFDSFVALDRQRRYTYAYDSDSSDSLEDVSNPSFLPGPNRLPGKKDDPTRVVVRNSAQASIILNGPEASGGCSPERSPARDTSSSIVLAAINDLKAAPKSKEDTGSAPTPPTGPTSASPVAKEQSVSPVPASFTFKPMDSSWVHQMLLSPPRRPLRSAKGYTVSARRDDKKDKEDSPSTSTPLNPVVSQQDKAKSEERRGGIDSKSKEKKDKSEENRFEERFSSESEHADGVDFLMDEGVERVVGAKRKLGGTAALY